MSTPLRVADLFRESVRGHNGDSYSYGDPYEMNRLARYEKDNEYKVALFNITHKMFQGNTEFCKDILNFLIKKCEGINSNNLQCNDEKYLYYVNNIGVIDKIEVKEYAKLPKRFKCFNLCTKFDVINYNEIYNNSERGYERTDVLVRERLRSGGNCGYVSDGDYHGKWIKFELCNINATDLGCRITKYGPIFCTYDLPKDSYGRDETYNRSHWRQGIPYNNKTKHLEGTNTDYKYSMFH